MVVPSLHQRDLHPIKPLINIGNLRREFGIQAVNPRTERFLHTAYAPLHTINAACKPLLHVLHMDKEYLECNFRFRHGLRIVPCLALHE